jgi:hypothetical protein
MKNKKHPYRFRYGTYWFEKIWRIGVWKGTYKHLSNWNCKGAYNSRYVMEGD